ncbi:hypothetical protein HDU76_009693 [Blyttiomyces sp. JEL0837]|nr:hypothetical protein HDU76_009693 [Blyttiomyces sp. JEL0837]
MSQRSISLDQLDVALASKPALIDPWFIWLFHTPIIYLDPNAIAALGSKAASQTHMYAPFPPCAATSANGYNYHGSSPTSTHVYHHHQDQRLQVQPKSASPAHAVYYSPAPSHHVILHHDNQHRIVGNATSVRHDQHHQQPQVQQSHHVVYQIVQSPVVSSPVVPVHDSQRQLPPLSRPTEYHQGQQQPQQPQQQQIYYPTSPVPVTDYNRVTPTQPYQIQHLQSQPPVQQPQQYKLYQPATSTISPTLQSYQQHLNVDHRYTSTTLPPIVTLSSTSAVPVVQQQQPAQPQQQQQQQHQPRYYPARVYNMDEQQKDGNKVQDDMQSDKVVTPVMTVSGRGTRDGSEVDDGNRRSSGSVVEMNHDGEREHGKIVGGGDEK